LPSGSIDVVTLILLYLVVLILVATVLFGVGSVLFGRGERLPPLPRATTATALPASEVTGADVGALKFTQTLRGYKVSEVDWALDRLGQELDQLHGQVAALRAAYGVDDFVPDSDSELGDDLDGVPPDAARAEDVHAAPTDGRDEP
jgi:DivIVA domain-containing protein